MGLRPLIIMCKTFLILRVDVESMCDNDFKQFLSEFMLGSGLWDIADLLCQIDEYHNEEQSMTDQLYAWIKRDLGYSKVGSGFQNNLGLCVSDIEFNI
jgi:hypothetical protein